MVSEPEPLTSSTQYGLLMICCWPSSYLQPSEASPHIGRSQAKDTHLIPIPTLLPGGPVSCLVKVTYLALLSVQIELMLANRHRPNGLDQCWTCVPRVHSNATVPKSPPGHRSPGRTRITSFIQSLRWGEAIHQTAVSEESTGMKGPEELTQKQAYRPHPRTESHGHALCRN